MQVLALLHLCCAIGRGRGDAHGVLWCGRRVLGFFASCFVGVQERREVGSRAFEQLQPWKRWPVAWIGCVGGGGGGLWWLAGHTNAAVTNQAPLSFIAHQNRGRLYAPNFSHTQNHPVPTLPRTQTQDRAAAGQEHNPKQRAWPQASFHRRLGVPPFLLAPLRTQ